jgi:hypothetical protein
MNWLWSRRSQGYLLGSTALNQRKTEVAERFKMEGEVDSQRAGVLGASVGCWESIPLYVNKRIIKKFLLSR